MARLPKVGLLVVMALGVASIAGGTLLVVGPQRLCEGVGGKWASTQSSCVTRSCFGSGTCGKWAYPSARCSNLKVGDSQAEAYFQLGEPDQVVQGEARWQAGKDSSKMIVAAFSSNRLQSLSCPDTP
jgi:hypothetical protein